MEAPKQIESAQPTPEQLLKLLDLQLGQERNKREHRSRNRATFLATGILFIIAAGGIALVVAQQMLAELQGRGGVPPSPTEMNEAR